MSQDNLTFRNSRRDGFKLSATTVELMRSYIQWERNQREAGGILLGRYILANNDVVVDQITAPIQEDVRTQYRFIRSKRGHQALARQAWSESRGTCHYLGEWHTHPEPEPSPSQFDILNWRRLLAHHRLDPDPLYFVIVGTKTIAAWQGYKGNLEIEKLALEFSDGRI